MHCAYEIDNRGITIRFPARERNFIFSKSSIPALGLSQPPVVEGLFGLKLSKRQANRSPPSTAKVNVWNYISSPHTPSEFPQEHVLLGHGFFSSSVVCPDRFWDSSGGSQEPFPLGELSGEWTWLLPLASAAVKNGWTSTSTFTFCCWGACLRTETIFSVINNVIATLELNWPYLAACQSLAAMVEDKNPWSFPCCPAVRPHGGVLTNRDGSGFACNWGIKTTISGAHISSRMSFVRLLGQCFSTAGPRPELYGTARGLRKLQYAARFH